MRNTLNGFHCFSLLALNSELPRKTFQRMLVMILLSSRAWSLLGFLWLEFDFNSSPPVTGGSCYSPVGFCWMLWAPILIMQSLSLTIWSSGNSHPKGLTTALASIKELWLMILTSLGGFCFPQFNNVTFLLLFILFCLDTSSEWTLCSNQDFFYWELRLVALKAFSRSTSGYLECTVQ